MIARTCLSILLLGLCLPITAVAVERNDIPDCYTYAQLQSSQPAPSGRELVVLIDQTTSLPPDLRTTALNTALRFVRPGDEVAIYAFSAYMAEDYTHLPFRGLLEPSIPEQDRNSIGMESMRKLDRCLQQQRQYFAQVFTRRFTDTLGHSDSQIAKSDILFNLQQIAASLAQDPAKHRVILVISDMLENSAFSSFYSHNAVRMIDPDKELAKAAKANLFGNFANATIYVHGAGLVSSRSHNTYRSGAEVEALQRFWELWFERSHGSLVGFGAPALTVDLK